MNRRWLIGGGAAVAIVMGVGAAVALSGGGSGDPIASPTTDPTLEPPVAGALPVPAYPAGAIPWDEVGPGWFLVTWSISWDPAFTPVLVGPDGSVYATDLELEDAYRVMDWVSDGLAMYHSTSSKDEEYEGPSSGDITIVDLQTRATQRYATDIEYPGWIWETQDGTHFGSTYRGEMGAWVTATKDGKYLGWYCQSPVDPNIPPLSPDGEHLACVTGPWSVGTELFVAGITGLGGVSKIETPLMSEDEYYFSVAGWLDADTFLAHRSPVITGDGATYFTYTVPTQTITDFVLPFDGDFTGLKYDPRSGVFVTKSGWGSPADFFSRDGVAIASVDCAETVGTSRVWADVETSGRRAIVTCGTGIKLSEGETAAIIVVDLDDGTTTVLGPVGAEGSPWADGEQANAWIKVFPYPEPY